MLLLFVSSTLHVAAYAQTTMPAIEYQSLLNMRFYEDAGGFYVDGLQLVFPPEGVQGATFLVTKSSGERVVNLPLRAKPFITFPVFTNLVPDGMPGTVKVGQAGNFVMSVEVGGNVITSLPFTLKEEKNNDLFNPKKKFLREGPWRELGFFSVPVDEANGYVSFSWWMSLREMPTGADRPLCTVHIMQGGQEIAASNVAVVPSSKDWQYFTRELLHPKNAGRRLDSSSGQYATMRTLTKKDEELTIIIKANGQPFKSFKAQAKSGELQRLEQNRLEFEPHHEFISPRFIDVSSGSSSQYKMRDAYWVKKSQQ